MRVLITGGAGYLGSVMVRRFLELGYEVTVIDNLMYKQSSLLDCCVAQQFNFVRCDCRDVGTYRKEISRADVVIPLAAITGAPACDRDKIAAKSTNLDAIWDLCRNLSNRQFVVYPNTNSGYGAMGGETTECTEESPLNPISYYGQLKCDAEKIVMDREMSTTFRLATVFGASQRMRLDLLVNDFVHRAVTDKFVVLFQSHFKRNYISIHDVASAFAFATKASDKMKREVYNLGLSDANLSKRELCELIKTHIPNFTVVDAEIGEDPDRRNYIVSNKKLNDVGFYPKFTLDQGVEELKKAFAIIRRTEFSNA